MRPNALLGRKVMAHVMVCYGNSQPHKNNSYKSNDIAVIADQIALMKLEEVDGVVICCSGFLASDTAVGWDATKKWCHMSLAAGMSFAVMLDQWSAKNLTPDPTTAFVNTISSADMQEMLAAPHYIPEKAVMEFDVAADSGVNVVAAQAKLPKTPIWSKHVQYSWPEITNTLATLKADNANPKMKLPGLCRRFNDSKIIAGAQAQSWWDPTQLGRFLYPSAGQFYAQQAALLPPVTQAPYAMLITWNDGEEETEIESDAAARWGYNIGHGKY